MWKRAMWKGAIPRGAERALLLFAVATVHFLLVPGLDAEAGGRGEARQLEFGRIEYLEGEVTVDEEPAELGEVVRPGSLIRTGPEGRCEIVFGDRNIFQLRENTILRLRWEEKDAPRVAELERGSFAAVLDRLQELAGSPSFEVRTHTAVGGVRGTVFFVSVESEESTYICTCNGETDLSGSSDDADRADRASTAVDADYHTAYRFVQEGATVSYQSAPLLYHTDEEMDTLAAKIGVTIPWSGY